VIGVSCSDIACGYSTRLRLHLILAGHVAALQKIRDRDFDCCILASNVTPVEVRMMVAEAEAALKGNQHG
jgi:hypothetical protein